MKNKKMLKNRLVVHSVLMAIFLVALTYSMFEDSFYLIAGSMAFIGFVSISSYGLFIELTLEVTFPLP